MPVSQVGGRPVDVIASDDLADRLLRGCTGTLTSTDFLVTLSRPCAEAVMAEFIPILPHAGERSL